MANTRGKYKKTDIKLQQLVSLLEGVRFKKLEQLSAALGPQTVEQTRRMLKQLEKMGYKIEKEPGKSNARRIYNKIRQDLPVFKFDEQLQLMEALEQSGISREIKDKLIALISSRIENIFPFYKEYNIILESMQKGRQLYIKKYTPRDHEGGEKTCTIGHVSLEQARAWAWSGHRQKFYALNIEKMSGLKVSKLPAESHPDWNQNRGETDLFGFEKQEKKIYEVRLRMTDFAYSMLKRQFPHADAHELKHLQNGFRWVLETIVYDIKPVARFVVGLFDEVIIDGNESVKKEIEAYFLNKAMIGYKFNFN